jgi:hypothetical protein
VRSVSTCITSAGRGRDDLVGWAKALLRRARRLPSSRDAMARFCLIVAELDIAPSLWFFHCHFPGDQFRGYITPEVKRVCYEVKSHGPRFAPQRLLIESKKAATFFASSPDRSPLYGFILLPGTTSSGLAIKRASFVSSQIKPASFMATE